MSYTNTFIQVSEDCPVRRGEIPVVRNEKVPAHLIQYQLLTNQPYQFDHKGLIYAVFIKQKGISQDVLATDAEKIKAELFSKGHPCLRASALVKRYGFGAHYNGEGKIALYPAESAAYQAFLQDPSVKVLNGMKSKR